MDRSLETIARLRLEEEFGGHAMEVLNAGGTPSPELQAAMRYAMQHALQLRLQEVATSEPRRDTRGWRPEYGDPESYLQAVYNAQQ